ncbi:MAG: hypothetical protein JSV03_08565 [Planctomycetota bacterium]|nr:MAG: hypothetical protein JSV03_08565 [Planctomycetota bacterium]
MDQSELLRFVTSTIENFGFRYLVTGSMVTIYFGEPRFTNDIDIVVDLPMEKIKEFCQAFPASEFYLNEEAIREAVRHCGQFNIIHPASGFKIDIIIPEDTTYNRSRFSRAMRVKPGEDYEASFASIEDVIIKKMEFYRDGGSEKHLRDITGVLKISGDRVDHTYIADWVLRLGLDSVWKAVLKRMGDKY